MPLIRRSEQKNESLEEFYKQWIPSPEDKFENVGTPMLEVLDFFNENFNETIIYGLTSHAHLLLFNSNEENSDYFIVIIACKSNYYTEYRIEYVVPKEQSPWEGAMIQGVTRSFEEFKKFIIISMDQSEGWKGNKELDNLYKKITN